MQAAADLAQKQSPFVGKSVFSMVKAIVLIFMELGSMPSKNGILCNFFSLLEPVSKTQSIRTRLIVSRDARCSKTYLYCTEYSLTLKSISRTMINEAGRNWCHLDFFAVCYKSFCIFFHVNLSDKIKTGKLNEI